MSFKATPQKFNAAIKAVEVGSGDKKIVLGGESVLPFYAFDGEIANAPKVGVEVSDLGCANYVDGIKEYYGTEDVVEMAKKAAAMPGADFICLNLEGADPNGEDKSVEDCVALAKAVADAVDVPLMVFGCNNEAKDAELLEKIADALQGKNAAFFAAKEENYKRIGAAVGLAYGQKVGAESAVDINLAKQLNVLLTQLGVDGGSIIMNVGSATAGYGFEYVASTMDRIKMAALSQNDATLQMPIVTPISLETWNVKESIMAEEDMPEWGCREMRGIDMEVTTAVACLASGSNAVILRHPTSVKTVSELVKALV